MKISLEQLHKEEQQRLAKAKIWLPPIALGDSDQLAPTKANSTQVKLLSNPTVVGDGSTFHLTVVFFTGRETVSQALHYLDMIKKVFVGQNITSGNPMAAMIRRLSSGVALAKFNTEMTTLGNETVPHCTTALNRMVRMVFPQRAVQTQTQHMTRHVKKPLELKAREFVTMFRELNAKLVRMAELLHEGAAPFDENIVKLSDERMKDAIYEALPRSWWKEMTKQNFDCVDHTYDEIIAFGERMELSEAMEPQRKDKSDKQEPTKPAASKKSHPKSKSKRSGTPMCALHGPGHWTEDCYTIKKMKKEHGGNKKPAPGTKSHGGKDFNKSKFKGYKSNAELNAFFDSKLKGFMQKQKDEVNALNLEASKPAIEDDDKSNASTITEPNNVTAASLDDFGASRMDTGTDDEFELEI